MLRVLLYFTMMFVDMPAMSMVIISIIVLIMMTVGLYFLFPKCGVKRIWAFVPFVRYYQLGRCANMPEEAVTWALSMFLTEGASIWAIVSQSLEDHLSGTAIYLAYMISVIFLGVCVVYAIRIFLALCKNFEKSRAWIPGWIFFDFVVAMWWGLKKDYVPRHRVDEVKASAAALSGSKAEVLDEGLSVDIRSRTVRDGVKRKVLLRDIHFSIHPGRMVLLCGGSGVGKSCLINAINGYEQADATVLLDGKDVYHSFNSVKYDIGYVPQRTL